MLLPHLVQLLHGGDRPRGSTEIVSPSGVELNTLDTASHSIISAGGGGGGVWRDGEGRGGSRGIRVFVARRGGWWV